VLAGIAAMGVVIGVVAGAIAVLPRQNRFPSALTTNGQTRAPVGRSPTDLAVRAYVSNIGGQ
jgi:hypothetical protein